MCLPQNLQRLRPTIKINRKRHIHCSIKNVWPSPYKILNFLFLSSTSQLFEIDYSISEKVRQCCHCYLLFLPKMFVLVINYQTSKQITPWLHSKTSIIVNLYKFKSPALKSKKLTLTFNITAEISTAKKTQFQDYLCSSLRERDTYHSELGHAHVGAV